MAQLHAPRLRKQAHSGVLEAQKATRADIHLADQLSARLAEKHRNYERAASRLEMAGEIDAARVLRRAAERLRFIRNADAFPAKCA